MSLQKIGIYGTGGFAREVAWLIECCNQPCRQYEVTCFVDHLLERQGQTMNGIPITSLEHVYSDSLAGSLVIALGNPKDRESATKLAEKTGFPFSTVIHPRVEMSKYVDVGIGSIICGGSILTTNISIGKHVQINLNCTIGHDVAIGDFTTLAPGVHISGRVHIGKRVFIGTGAVIIDGSWKKPLTIEDDAVIGAGACVTASVATGQTYVGVPAKPIRHR